MTNGSAAADSSHCWGSYQEPLTRSKSRVAVRKAGGR